MGTSFDRRDDGNAYVGYVFQSLNAFIVNLAPNPPGSATSPKEDESTSVMNSPPAPVRITILPSLDLAIGRKRLTHT